MKIVRRRRGRRCHRRRRSRASNPLLSRHVSRPHRAHTLKPNTKPICCCSFVLKRKIRFFGFFERDIFRVFLKWCKTYFITNTRGSALFLKYPVVVARVPSEDVPKKKMCVFMVRVTLLCLLLLVMTPENVTTRYQHVCDEGNARKQLALSFSLFLSLFLYIRLRLSLKKRTRMATTFFSSKLRWYQQLVFNLVQRVF